MIKIHLIAAARPNFMKVAPLYHALKAQPWVKPYIVYTGQHYDVNMSDAFFADLNLPEPHFHLGVGSGSHAEQTGNVMIAYEKVLMETRTDMVVVVGDVNSTLACTLATVKVSYNHATRLTVNGEQANRPLLGHLEAGLRSFDRTMPEEINRLVTDALADVLWTPSQDADKNLIREGISKDKIFRVGNIMIDSLEMLRNKIEKQNSVESFGLNEKEYALATLHRPSNVDDPDSPSVICEGLLKISERINVLFPLHPRTRKNLNEFGLLEKITSKETLIITEPLSYLPFMNLVFNSRLVLTDSGGLQEETTYLGIPCLTLRPNTERPVTIEKGTNRLTTKDTMVEDVIGILGASGTNYQIPELWDGKTACRVVESIKRIFNE